MTWRRMKSRDLSRASSQGYSPPLTGTALAVALRFGDFFFGEGKKKIDAWPCVDESSPRDERVEAGRIAPTKRGVAPARAIGTRAEARIAN